jgi:5-methylcytosine-specific restriction endonuclease McrA
MFNYENPLYYTSKEYYRNKRKGNRKSKAYHNWRIYILERDHYACVKCGSKEHLYVHHLKQYCDNVFLRIKKSNGVTLCEKCHKKLHPWMDKSNDLPKNKIIIRRKISNDNST